MKNIKYIWVGLVLAIGTVFSCTEMDDNYSEFTKSGEIIYSKKVDSVAVYPGKNRVKMSFVNLGPRVAKVKIFWNLKSQFIEAAVPATNRNLDVIVPNLIEGTYSFDLITFDASGNQSVTTTVIGNVYGDSYANTLRGRTATATNIAKGTATVNWSVSPPGAIATEVKYVDNAGAAKVVYAPFNTNTISLAKYKSGNSFTFRTLFLPEPKAIDTFYTAPVSQQIVQLPALVDKSKFANVKIVGDHWAAHTPNGGTWNIERAWDGITGDENILFHATRKTTWPHYITIDIGTLTKLTSMKMFTRPSAKFNLGHIKKFAIYGRADAPNLNDASLAGWTKILDGESIKPSGLPVGQTNAADLALIAAGEDSQFFPDAAPVRYIRIEVQDNWGIGATDTYWYISELNLFGFEQ